MSKQMTIPKEDQGSHRIFDERRDYIMLQVKDNIIEYNGHQGTFEIDWENKELHGRLLGIDAIDVYGGTTMEEFEEAFIEAVNDAIDDGYYEDTELMEM